MSVSYTNHRSYGTAAKKPAKAAHAGKRLVAQDFDPHGMAIAISESQRICCCRAVRERGSQKNDRQHNDSRTRPGKANAFCEAAAGSWTSGRHITRGE